MAEIIYVSGDRVKPGQKPLAIASDEDEIQTVVNTSGMTKAAVVELPGGIYGIYSLLQINPGESKQSDSVDAEERRPSPPSNATPTQTKTKEEKGKWVKITPEMIWPGRRIKRISGSNAGRTAIIRNVVRPGKPDGQTLHLVSEKDDQVAFITTGNTERANTILQTGEMRMYSLGIPKTDNVVIEWEAPKEETTVQNTVVNGVKLNSRTVSAPMTHANVPKGKICSDFLMWVPEEGF